MLDTETAFHEINTDPLQIQMVSWLPKFKIELFSQILCEAISFLYMLHIYMKDIY